MTRTISYHYHFKFRITMHGGATYYTDSADSVLCIIDNNRANKNGRVIERVEYAPMLKKSRWFKRGTVYVCGKFRLLDPEQLRRFHIAEIYDVDARRDDARTLIIIIALLAFVGLAIVAGLLAPN